jgi:hypothetical protein
LFEKVIIRLPEFIKRVDVWLVHSLEALFLPTGLPAWTISPFVDAALDLAKSVRIYGNRIKHSSYHREDKGDSRDWQRGKMFFENKPIIYAVAKPRDVDSLLDRGMLVWVMKYPIRIIFLRHGQWVTKCDEERQTR